MERRHRLILILLVAAHIVLAGASQHRRSVTVDEVAHLPAGVSYWQTGSFALYHHNPPLVKLLAAVPVLASGAHTDYRDSGPGSWGHAQQYGYPPSHAHFAERFMRLNADRYFELYFRARWVIVAMSLVGLLVTYSWAREWFGTEAGLAAAALWALSPNMLAHAGLVTTDAGATVASLAATYAFWRWLRRPKFATAVVAGMALGLAQLVKFSLLLLCPIWLIAGLLYAFIHRWSAVSPGPMRWPLTQVLTILGLSVLVINLGYGFEGTGRALGGFPFLSRELTVPRTGGKVPYHPDLVMQKVYQSRQNRFEGTVLGWLPVPLPEHYVLGFDEQRFETNPRYENIPELREGGYPVYLRGQWGRRGWWYYYIYALAIKVPLSTWALLLAAAMAAVTTARVRSSPGNELFLALPPLAILASMSFLTDINLGLRYVLLVLPFIWISASRICRLPGATMMVVWAALGWNAITTFAYYPHYLSYFNQLVGGPQNGQYHLLDSNIDWGQDLLELKRWLQRHPKVEPVGLAYFGLVDPAVAGIRFWLPPMNEAAVHRHPTPIRAWGQSAHRDRPTARSAAAALPPGYYAISVNYVFGLPFRTYNEDGRLVPVPQEAYTYFQKLKPIGRAGYGYSIWIYQIGPRPGQPP